MYHRTELDKEPLDRFVPSEVWPLDNHQTDLPRIARDPRLTGLIGKRLLEIPTSHRLFRHDARDLSY